MKRIISVISTFLLSLPVISDTIKTVELSYNLSNFTFRDIDNNLYISSSDFTITLDPDTLKPALPFVPVYVLIDVNSECSNYGISASETLVRQDVTIAPNPQIAPNNQTVTHSAHQPIEYAEASYPSIAVEYKGTYMMGGYKVLGFSVCPFRYDAANRNLYLKSNITLSVNLANTGRRSFSNPSPGMRSSVRKLVHNGTDMDNMYPLNTRALVTSDTTRYEYLIITCDSLRDEFQRLANWKTVKGIRSKVLTVENIYNNTSGNRQQLKIKQAIKDCYDDSGHFLQYVLLAGDHEIVPTEQCYTQYNSFSGLKKVHLATDLFYSSFNNMNWDTNNNDSIGEVGDNIDISSDVIVTRLSVNSVLDAKNQIDRIINYERCPNTNNWEDKILLSGMTLDDQLYGPDRFSDTNYKSEHFLYPNYIQNNWPQHTKYMFYDTETSFEGGRLYHFRRENMQEQLSLGYTFINVETHGYWDCWKMEYRPEQQEQTQLYYTTDAAVATNPRNTIITTTACQTNGFDSIPTCLGEAFMRNKDCNILGYYGCSHYGWHYNGYQTENPSAKFVGKFYENLFTDNRHQLGRAVYDSKAYFRNSSNGYGTERWLTFGMTALCDPEMPVYLSVPQKFSNANVSRSGNTLSVTTGQTDCKICVMSLDDNGASYYVVNDSVSSGQYTIGAGTYSVCITKQGYIPYVALFSDNLYIQDEKFNYDVDIWANQVFIGEDVTTTKPQGPVINTGGSMIIHSPNGVTITGGFEVETGAEFEITTGN